ncbi:hypothetical protein GCM10027053_05400 [Intrasporangium mesophilum]
MKDIVPKNAALRESTRTHTSWCNDHFEGDAELGWPGYCRHSMSIKAAEGRAEVWIVEEDGNLVITPYVLSDTALTAAEALQYAENLTRAAAILESAALPDPPERVLDDGPAPCKLDRFWTPKRAKATHELAVKLSGEQATCRGAGHCLSERILFKP